MPTVLIADDPDLLATAREAYSDWAGDPLAAEPRIEIRLRRGSASSEGVSCGILVEGSRLTLRGGGIEGFADAVARRGECVVPRRLIGDPAALAAEVLDSLLLFLLTRSGRTPIHAAGIVIGDAAIVLAGPSGTGKSSLALAAARRGLRVLSDDSLYVQREPALRIWGFPRPVHVFPEDAPPGTHPTRFRGGKIKMAVPLAPQASQLSADSALPILLERGDRVALVEIEPAAALAGFARLEPGFDLLAEDSAEAARVLTKDGAWRLTLGSDPDAAIDILLGRFGNPPPAS